MPGHVLPAGGTAGNKAGMIPTLREVTIFEFKIHSWIGNRAESLFSDEPESGIEGEGSSWDAACCLPRERTSQCTWHLPCLWAGPPGAVSAV